MAKKKQEAKLKEPVSIWTITLVMLFFGMKTR